MRVTFIEIYHLLFPGSIDPIWSYSEREGIKDTLFIATEIAFKRKQKSRYRYISQTSDIKHEKHLHEKHHINIYRMAYFRLIWYFWIHEYVSSTLLKQYFYFTVLQYPGLSMNDMSSLKKKAFSSSAH
jgi:hypothetical protein